MTVLAKYAKDITYCTYCPRLCRFACPVTNAETRETVTPTNKMNLLELLRSGAAQMDAGVADIFYRCAGCLTCRAYCKWRIDVPRVMERARALAVEKGVQPGRLNRHISTFAEHGNPYGKVLAAKFNALGLEDRVDKTADTLLFLGCTTIFHFPNLAKAIVKLLDAAGIDFAVHGEEDALCCGTPALYSGAHKDFESAARRLKSKLGRYKTIISGCPSCLASFSIKYPEHGIAQRTRTLHTAELAAQLLDSKRIKVREPFAQSAMYHDPCHLAKYFGIYDAPRRILSALFEPDRVFEFSWNRDKNYCCGGGGLIPVTDPALSKSITRKRLEQFYEAAPDMLVTACPTCERTFHRADPDIETRDLIELLAERLDA